MITMSTGLIYLDCSGGNTENATIYIFFLSEYGDSVVLVTLTAIFLSIIVDIELGITKIFPTVSHYLLCSIPKDDRQRL